jgi:phage tail sheath protein FI
MADRFHSEGKAPGVYRQEVFPSPAPSFLTGVPVFLGYTADGPYEPQRLALWPQFDQFGPPGNGYLADAVRGFFENDGLVCYVQRLEFGPEPAEALRRGLEPLDRLEDVDLVCAPDVMHTAGTLADPDLDTVVAMQREILDHCDRRGDRFAILDGLPGADAVAMQHTQLVSDAGALYYPWAWPASGDRGPYVPPCGHVAGVYSRSDRAHGVHKAPANEVVDGVLDLQVHLGDAEVGELTTAGVNCLWARPGGGVRVWGSRTLSDDLAWRYVNVRRVFLTLGRWLDRFMAGLVHEPNDVRLWVRIMRDVTGYLEDLFQRGALKGRTSEEAFYVKCDSVTNPPEVRDAGMVVTEVGVAVAIPAEFVVARIIHGASGVSITT